MYRHRRRDAARPSETESVTSRCCAPSWRFRSIRRRSASPAATIRPREARTSASCDRTSAASRSFSSTSSAVARTDSTSAGSSSKAGSWTSSAISSPSLVTAVTARAGPSGSSTGRPSASTYRPSSSRYATSSDGSPSAWASRSFRLPAGCRSQLDDQRRRIAATQPGAHDPRDDAQRERDGDPAGRRLEQWTCARRTLATTRARGRRRRRQPKLPRAAATARGARARVRHGRGGGRGSTTTSG